MDDDISIQPFHTVGEGKKAHFLRVNISGCLISKMKSLTRKWGQEGSPRGGGSSHAHGREREHRVTKMKIIMKTELLSSPNGPT